MNAIKLLNYTISKVYWVLHNLKVRNTSTPEKASRVSFLTLTELKNKLKVETNNNLIDKNKSFSLYFPRILLDSMAHCQANRNLI